MIETAKAAALFEKTFHKKPESFVFSHGRLELLGNHTDHNHGLCLVGAANLGITAAIARRDDGFVEMLSEGYRVFRFSISDLHRRGREKGTSLAIVRGILSGMKEKGMKIGGFTAALVCDIPSGSGLSSSACYESLVAKIVDVLYNDGHMDPLTMAKIGQYAENVYFGKPSGLLDQIGTSFGGVAFLDFHRYEEIQVKSMEFTLPLDITVIITPSSHASLTSLYASIPADMKTVAEAFGKKTLGELEAKAVLRELGAREELSPRAKDRARHFYEENRRVEIAKGAIENGDPLLFLEMVRQSQASSSLLLRNTMVEGHYENSPQQAVDRANKIIGKGAARIMGGGFAGSILCFTEPLESASFREKMASFYGEEAIKPIKCLAGGPKEVDA